MPDDAGSTSVNRVELPLPATPVRVSTWLREAAGVLTVRAPCEVGQCGSCAVLVDGSLMLSCLLVTPQVASCDILTLEGVGEDGDAATLMSELIAADAFQCGFCSSGVTLALTAWLRSGETLLPYDSRAAIAGCVCRCSGYLAMLAAADSAARTLGKQIRNADDP